jgi:predicted nuclease of restriction endonuclease-like (RecB) superfamily
MTKTTTTLPKDYKDFLRTIKQQIHESRIRSYLAVNRELIDLYWNIGKEIAERQEREGWGKSVVERLSRDLREDFPGTTGFSTPNLWFMRQMYIEYREFPNLLQLVREIPWGQNITIMKRSKTPPSGYYLQMTANGLERNVPLHRVQTDACRHKKAVKQHNFEKHCPLSLRNRRMRR